MSTGINGVSSGGTSPIVSGASSYSAASNLYKQIDTTGAGSVTQSQLTQLLQSTNYTGPSDNTGTPLRPPIDAGRIFNQLPSNDSGSVSRQDFISGLSKLIRTWRGGGSSGSGNTPAQTLASSLQSLQQLGDPSGSSEGSTINFLA